MFHLLLCIGTLFKKRKNETEKRRLSFSSVLHKKTLKCFFLKLRLSFQRKIRSCFLRNHSLNKR